MAQPVQVLPKYTVVIPLYNKAAYIERALDSVLKQTVLDYEIIVVDDGSTDYGIDIVQQFTDPRMRLISQENRGRSAARNRGAQEACGELIALLDADDEWKPGFLETLQRLVEKYPQAGAYATCYEIIAKGEKARPPRVSGMPDPAWEGILENYFRIALDEQPFNASSLAMRKTVFQTAGGFLEIARLGEDLDLWIRIALSYPIAYSTSPQSIYHQDAESWGGLSNLYQQDIPFAHTIQTALAQGKVPEGQRDDLRELLARHQLYAVHHNMLAGDRENAKRMLDSIEYTRRFRMQRMWWRVWTSLPMPFFKTARQAHRVIKKVLD